MNGDPVMYRYAIKVVDEGIEYWLCSSNGVHYGVHFSRRPPPSAVCYMSRHDARQFAGEKAKRVFGGDVDWRIVELRYEDGHFQQA